jgi:hypothetical protein
LLLGKARLIHLLLGVEHVEQWAGTKIEILLLIQLAGAGAERFLTALDLKRAHQAHHLAARFQQFLPHLKTGALDGGLGGFHRVSGGVTPGGEAATLIERHLHFNPRGVLGAVPRFVARVAVVQVVTNFRLQRNGRGHLRVGIIEICLRDVGLRPGR